MALDAWFTFTSENKEIGKAIKVLECDFDFSQEIDETGKPSAITRGGLIHITIESTDDQTIANWMFSKMDLKNGKIDFSLRNSKRKELTFEEGACISYNESFNSENSLPMMLRFTISANKVKLGSAEFSNNWKTMGNK